MRGIRRQPFASLFTLSLMVLAVLSVTPLNPAHALAGSQLTVTSQDTTGTTITGFYTVLFDSAGTVLATGFTPVTFTTTAGLSYYVQADSYGNCIFSGWSDGVGTNPRPFTATAGALSFTSVYNCGTTTTTTTSTTSSTSAAGTSQLTVNTQVNGAAFDGFYTVLYQNSVAVATGYTPVQFTLNNGQPYVLEVQNYGNYYFQYWLDTGSVNNDRTLTTSASLSLTAVMCNGPPGTCAEPTPANGITVYVHRIPASYWAPCFATVCSAGTGPGSAMYVALLDSSGNLVQSGFANEQGYTFMGLSPGATYYVYPDDCNLCHGSAHDVVFQYWTGGATTRPMAATVGTSLDAWYSCTNNCA